MSLVPIFFSSASFFFYRVVRLATPIFIATGVSPGLTIRFAPRQLKPMATSVRHAYPRVRIIICGTIAN
jgi:hypothetical protein